MDMRLKQDAGRAVVDGDFKKVREIVNSVRAERKAPIDSDCLVKHLAMVACVHDREGILESIYTEPGWNATRHGAQLLDFAARMGAVKTTDFLVRRLSSPLSYSPIISTPVATSYDL
jgi:hypothetical protein